MALRHSRLDGSQLSPRPMRSASISSDAQSAGGWSTVAPPRAVHPLPAYISPSGVAQRISAEFGETVAAAPAALSLVNEFLDQILFSILNTAKSTSLGPLKVAVPAVLKPRLGKSVLLVAEEELREYLEESDDDDLGAVSGAPESKADFNLDLAWKLARLRCMVYSGMGDLEEEDEEDYVEQEQLHDPASGVRHRSVYLGPASAIFLTAVLEYLGEQALLYAAQHALRRVGAATAQEENADDQDPTDTSAEALLIQETDMSQIGRESPLSRLWRSWKKAVRTSKDTHSRPMSPDPSADTSPRSARGIGLGLGSPVRSISEEQPSLGKVLEVQTPSQIPLPMSERDVDEIEVPGLAREFSDEENEQPPGPGLQQIKRPVSMTAMSGAFATAFLPRSSQGTSNGQPPSAFRPKPYLHRSNSLPGRVLTLFTGPYATRGQDSTRHPDPAGHESEATEPIDTGAEGAEEKAVSGTEPAADESSIPLDEHAQLGKVAAAVSAVAGALGLGALAVSGPAQSDGSHETEPMQMKTVAEHLLGPSTHVAPPTDAVTGASITEMGDFDGIHMPEQQYRAAKEVRAGDGDAESDPEDLALSSADEDSHTVTHQSEHAPGTQALGTHAFRAGSAGSAREIPVTNGTSFYHEADDTEDAVPANGMGTGLTDLRHATSQDTVQTVRPANAPSNIKGVTMLTEMSRPSSGITGQSPRSAVSQMDEENFIDASSRPATADSTRVPARVSSIESASRKHSHSNPRTSQRSSHSKSSSSSSKLLGFNRDQQRAELTPDGHRRSANGAGTPQPAASEMIPVSSSSSRRKPLSIGTGSEQGSGLDDEEKKRSLEVLIKSDQTLHYTLTPVSAREENFSLPLGRTTETQDLADFLRNTQPPSEDRPTTSRSLKHDAMNGLRSSPGQAEFPPAAPAPNAFIPFSRSAPSAAPSNKPKSSRGEPRDPRVEPGTTRDLADYVRSTGPESASQLPGLIPPLARSLPGSSSGASSKTATQPLTNRLKYQAREATVPRHSGTEDLIDFIREGPPWQTGDRRSVAPFRRTMDSDDMNGLSSTSQDHDRNGTSSVASTQNSSVAKSLQSSMNSRTGLLDSASRPTYNGTQTVKGTQKVHSLQQTAVAEENGMPQRTRRRVRDPYAIDDSDDDPFNDDDHPTPKRKTQQESLIDFLRNTAPPPSMTAQPLLAANSSVATPFQAVRKEPSTGGLKERLLRKTSVTSVNRRAHTANSNATATATSTNGTSAPRVKPPSDPDFRTTTNGAREESPHLSQKGSKMDSYRPTKPTHAGHVDRVRQQKRAVLEARDPRTDNRGGLTKDLADYLRNSGPPPPTESLSKRIEPKESPKESGFLKRFSKRGVKK